MKARFQIITEGEVVLDTELTVRNKWTALHELLGVCGVTYNPTRFKERGDWVQFELGKTIYRTSTKFG